MYSTSHPGRAGHHGCPALRSSTRDLHRLTSRRPTGVIRGSPSGDTRTQHLPSEGRVTAGGFHVGTTSAPGTDVVVTDTPSRTDATAANLGLLARARHAIGAAETLLQRLNAASPQAESRPG
jgi:hypothetical protein